MNGKAARERKGYKNYRGISLLRVAGEIYAGMY